MEKQFLSVEIPTQPITSREQELIDIIKSIHLMEYLELENIKYKVHCTDIENAYLQGFKDGQKTTLA